MRLIAVTPTYNERDSIALLLQRLRLEQGVEQVVVVDDGSPDGTAEVVTGVAQRLGGVQLLRRDAKRGLASAYVAGFTLALELGADRVVQLDADLSHDPAALPRLLGSPAQLVLGSRYVPGGGTRHWAPHRRALSRFGSLYARACLGLPYRDLTGGYKLWRAEALRAVLQEPMRADGYAFQVETTLRAHRQGFSIAEVPIVFTERSHGASKMSLRVAAEASWLVPALRLK